MLFLLGTLSGTVAGCLMAGGPQRLPVPPNVVVPSRARAMEPPFAA
jgi:hypothetical protein